MWRTRWDVDRGSAFDSVPIIPHGNVADVDCCGCLTVHTRGDQADIVCDECGAVIRTVAVGDVEAAILELAQTDTVCSAQCPHCGALNIFPGMSAQSVHLPRMREGV